MSIIRWQIYCNTEEAWTQGFLNESAGPPTVCFNNNTHTVNPNSPQQIDGTQLFSVKVIQEDIPTGGHYTSEGFSMTIPPLSTEILPISWPMQISCKLVHIQSTIENLGDTLNAIVNPYTLIGGIISNVAENSNIAIVNVTVIANIKVGFEFYIGTEHLGRVIEINNTNSTITFENNTSILHTVGEPVYTEMKIIRNLELGMNNGYDLGQSSLGGKHLKPNVITNIIYTNNSNVEKTLKFSVEYFF